MVGRRKLFLHVGCGKTGSSALQNWLLEVSSELRNEGISYAPSTRPIDKVRTRIMGSDRTGYEITSGNGVRLLRAIEAEECGKIISFDARSFDGDLMYSSETFQSLNETQLAHFNAVAKGLGFDVVIILFLRDVYDIIYSSYQQLVKRHDRAQNFREFGIKVHLPQQFRVLRNYESVFGDVRVLHYDSEKRCGLDQAFLRAIGVSERQVPAMKSRTVNRSLTVLELEFLRRANGILAPVLSGGAWSFSRDVSDKIIMSRPERETEVFLDRDVAHHLEVNFGDEVERINREYFRDNRLRVFSPEGKRIVTEIPEVDEAFDVILESTFQRAKELSVRAKGLSVLGSAREWARRRWTEPASAENEDFGRISGEIGNSFCSGEPRFRGWVDRADGRGLWGWVIRCSDSSDGVEVVVVLDGVPIGRARCEQERPDVAGAGFHPTGKCGFSFKWPHGGVSPGPHDFEVQVLEDVNYRFKGRFVV